MQKRVKLPAEDVAEPYKPSPHELSAMEEFLAKNKEAPLAPGMNVSENDGVTQIAFNHPEADVAKILLMKALGTHNVDFLAGILHQLENATSGQTVNGQELNFMLAVIEGLKPTDQIDTMLVAQMAIVHMATMAFGSRLARSESVIQSDLAQRALCKLARTFAAQVEALKRNRCNCEHRVTVEEVKANAGIATTSRQPSSKSNGQYHAKQNGHAPQSPLRRSSSQRKAMPVTGDAERPLPDARRKLTRSAERK
jgi:hypothetical protein